MIEYNNFNKSAALRFSTKRTVTDEMALTISVIITAVLAKYISPGSVRVYRIVRIRDAFWSVKIMRLHALIPIDFAAENEKKTLFSHENMDVMLSNLNHYMNKQIHGCLSFKVTPQLMRGIINLEIKKKYFSK